MKNRRGAENAEVAQRVEFVLGGKTTLVNLRILWMVFCCCHEAEIE